MKRKDNIALSILSMIGLWAIIILLSSAVIRLFYAIIRTFIYLVGLISVLLMVVFLVCVVSYIIYKTIKLLTNYHRSTPNSLQLIHSIISIQFKTIIGLVFIYLTLGIIYFINC